MLAIAVVGLTWLFGCSRTRRATWLVLGCLFAPTIPLFALSFWIGNPRKLIFQLGSAFFGSDLDLAGLVYPEASGAILFSTAFLATVTCIRFLPGTRITVVFLLAILALARIALWVVFGSR